MVWFWVFGFGRYIAGMLIGIITSLFPVVFWLSYIITVANLCLTAYVLLSHKGAGNPTLYRVHAADPHTTLHRLPQTNAL